MDAVALIKDLVTTLAAAMGAVVAVLGLETWEAQLHGKRSTIWRGGFYGPSIGCATKSPVSADR